MRNPHILIIRLSALGDIAMLVPVVHSLATQYPDLRVTVLSRAQARPLFDGLAPNVGFMDADVNKEYKGLPGLNALYRRLKAKHFTAIADMHGVLRTKYLRMRFSIDRYQVAHIDKHRSGKRRLVAKDNKRLVQQPTSFQNYADVLAQLGYPIKLEFKSIFPVTGGNLRLLGPRELQEKKTFQQWIGVAPFAAHQGKVYPLEKLEVVVDRLLGMHPNARIFLFGAGRRERKVLDQWCERYPRCHAQWFGRGTDSDQPSRCDALDGQRQHASGLGGGCAGGECLGSNASLCRLRGMAPGRGHDGAVESALPSVQRVWQQALLSWRHGMHERHHAGNDYQ